MGSSIWVGSRGWLMQQSFIRMQKSLVGDSKNLSALSLQAFLSDLYSQGDNLNFSEMLSHPQISSIGPAHLSLLKVFINASYSAYLAAPELPALTPLQHRTLRKLTLLKAVQGLTLITFRHLQSLLHSSEDEVIALLLEMAIANQIQIRIDQPKGLIHLLASEPLASSAPSSKALIGAIDRTLWRNLEICRSLSQTCRLIE